MSKRLQYARGAKRHDVNYAVLHTGQEVPDIDDSPKKKKKIETCYRCKQSQGPTITCKTCFLCFHISCLKNKYVNAMDAQCIECVKSLKNGLNRSNISTIDQLVDNIKKAKHIVVVCGAGISVSCGIPDFRSKNGIYSMVSEMNLDLPDPESLFDIEFFRSNPKPFFQFARDVFTNKQYEPSLTHRFLQLLQANGQLLRVYTQNIDGLEEIAGVKDVIQCHGTFTTSSCMSCNTEFQTKVLFDTQSVPFIPRCHCGGVIKPNITFFGQSIPDITKESLIHDRLKVDLVLVIGTSLQVSPVADIPSYLHGAPQVLINLESIKPKGRNIFHGFDLELLGKCDAIVSYLMSKLGWADEILHDLVLLHRHEPNIYCFESCSMKQSNSIALNDPFVETFQCDNCGKEISTPRYSCTTCFDYDLCLECYPTTTHMEGFHHFDKIQ